MKSSKAETSRKSYIYDPHLKLYCITVATIKMASICSLSVKAIGLPIASLVQLFEYVKISISS